MPCDIECLPTFSCCTSSLFKSCKENTEEPFMHVGEVKIKPRTNLTSMGVKMTPIRFFGKNYQKAEENFVRSE